MSIDSQAVQDTVRLVLQEVQRIRSIPSDEAPTRAGAAQLEDILGGRAGKGSFRPAAIAKLRKRAIGTLEKLSGDNQAAATGQGLASPLTLRVVSADGTPLDDVDVRFVVSAGDGELTTFAATSSSTAGKAAAAGIVSLQPGEWLLGPNGENRVTAIAGNASVDFTARAATRMTAASATSQSAKVNTPVAEDPTVLVVDANGYAVPGVTVTFTVIAGGGSTGGSNPPPDRRVTDNTGRAKTQWKLGTSPGPNSLRAEAGGLRVEFTATGTP